MNFLKNKVNIFLTVIIILITGLIYYRWFAPGLIIGGDWPFLFDEALKEFPLAVPSWNTWLGNGLGGTSSFYFLQSFENFTTAFVNFLHIPWVIVYKFLWFGLFLFFSFFTSSHLLKTILSKINFGYILIAGMIYSTNTYILMVVGGGQMGVALAYSTAPLVMFVFIKLTNLINSSYSNSRFQIQDFKWSVIVGLILSLQVMFDPRITYITMIAVTVYLVLNLRKSISHCLSLILYVFLIPGLITVLLHAVWILPILISKQNYLNDLNSANISVGIVKFLSFASFPQSFSLLHPNWPENIFGKIYFMKAEFMLLPIIAYSSLLFKFRRKILFFALLGIVGAFLAKGANPPFGEAYLWLFENIPGFMIFRDPTKFYLLIALSYSILIPFGIYSFFEWIHLRFKFQKYLLIILFTFFICYWAFLTNPAIFGQLSGTFRKSEVPKEYILLKDFLYKQPEFFRTLWIPRQQRFSFVSNVHPSVETYLLFNATGAAEAVKIFRKSGSREYLAELSIKYVIVPYDSLGEIFQKDRRYNEKEYNNTVNGLIDIDWLRPIDGFGKIKVFETRTFKKHFYLEEDGKISYKMISPIHYSVSVSINEDQNLIFSEKYNSYWAIKMNDKIITSKRTSTNLNSFSLKKGESKLEVIFLQEKFYNYGRILSITGFLIILVLLLRLRKSSNLSN
jgi:hypothetical protein